MESVDFKVDEGVSSYGLALSDVVSSEKLIPLPSCKGARKGRLIMLDDAVSFLLKPLKQVAESSFAVLLKSEDTQACFSMIASYC